MDSVNTEAEVQPADEEHDEALEATTPTLQRLGSKVSLPDADEPDHRSDDGGRHDDDGGHDPDGGEGQTQEGHLLVKLNQWGAHSTDSILASHPAAQARVQFLEFLKCFSRIFRCRWDLLAVLLKSGQRLENVHQTQLVLASGTTNKLSHLFKSSTKRK